MTSTKVRLLVFSLCIQAQAFAGEKTETFSTPAGPVTSTTQTVDPVPQQITVVSPSEARRFKQFAGKADDFVAAYLGAGTKASLETLDLAFRRWQTTPKPKFSNDEVVQILGAFLGNRLVSDLGMEWVTVRDQDGTDYAVRSKRVEVIAYPFSSVLKRIEKSQFDFMAILFYAVERRIKEDRAKPRSR